MTFLTINSFINFLTIILLSIKLCSNAVTVLIKILYKVILI